MKREVKACAAGIDIGAGSGAKMGLFDRAGSILAEGLLPIEQYGGTPDGMARGLADTLKELLRGNESPRLESAGVAMPGFSCSDGTVRCNNLPFLDGTPFADLVRKHLDAPVFTVNDADAGGLAEWSQAKTALLYWVFGGGWGGAWVSDDGQVQYPSSDWNGDDDMLHYSNEPGYAIPLRKSWLAKELAALGGSMEVFEQVCLAERQWRNNKVTGPNDRDDCMRAEQVVSGNGRWRLFRTFATADREFEKQLNENERACLQTPSVAGRVIDKLAEAGSEVAMKTDRLFGLALAEAGEAHFRSGPRGNCPDGMDIYVGGKPSRAMKFFGPVAQEAMKKKGLKSQLKLSWFSARNLNANLAGAAVLAWKKLDESVAAKKEEEKKSGQD